MTPRTPPPAFPTRMQYHVITTHEHYWPFDTPEDALKMALEELTKGNSVHIYPFVVTA